MQWFTWEGFFSALPIAILFFASPFIFVFIGHLVLKFCEWLNHNL